MRPGYLPTLAAALHLVHAGLAYDFVREYKGSSFFEEWEFYGYWDNLTLDMCCAAPTDPSDANWVNSSTAWQNELVSVNSFGNAVIRADRSVVPWNSKRDAVRITSKHTYDLGTLFIIDVYHIPWGCGTWGAIWTKGPDWPNGGEIDIVEGINMQSFNQVALHTVPGCTRDETGWQSGEAGQPDCAVPAGCWVRQTDSSQPSYGEAFGRAGGGVWAVQYDIQGIFVWFWTRGMVPAELYNPPEWGLDMSGWGAPAASYPGTTCDMIKHFQPQELVIDITFCGNWAGIASVYAETCAGQPGTEGQPATGNCYLDNVVGPGSPRFDNSYFEISHIRAFTTGINGPTAPVQSGPAPTETAQNTPTSVSAPTGTAQNTPTYTPAPAPAEKAQFTPNHAPSSRLWPQPALATIVLFLLAFF